MFPSVTPQFTILPFCSLHTLLPSNLPPRLSFQPDVSGVLPPGYNGHDGWLSRPPSHTRAPEPDYGAGEFDWVVIRVARYGAYQGSFCCFPNLAARLHAWQVDDLGYNYPGYHNSEVLAIARKHLGRLPPVSLPSPYFKHPFNIRPPLPITTTSAAAFSLHHAFSTPLRLVCCSIMPVGCSHG